MASTSIIAHLQDMQKASYGFDDLAASVKSIRESMDSFLNTRASVNGTTIYANWNSQARDIFAEKVESVLVSMESLALECTNAAETLRAVIATYSASDLASAGVTNNVQSAPMTFKFGGK